MSGFVKSINDLLDELVTWEIIESTLNQTIDAAGKEVGTHGHRCQCFGQEGEDALGELEEMLETGVFLAVFASAASRQGIGLVDQPTRNERAPFAMWILCTSLRIAILQDPKNRRAYGAGVKTNKAVH